MSPCNLQTASTSLPNPLWNGEGIPPDPRFRHRHSRRGQVERGIKPLDDLKWVDVDVERMRSPGCGRVVKKGPLFGCAKLHVLIDFPLNCLPLIVCIGAAFGMKGAGALVGLRPPGVPCGVGVGLGLVNCVRVVLKRISRFNMPTGGTMSDRKPGILGN